MVSGAAVMAGGCQAAPPIPSHPIPSQPSPARTAPGARSPCPTPQSRHAAHFSPERLLPSSAHYVIASLPPAAAGQGPIGVSSRTG